MARLDEQSGLPMLRRVPRAHSIIVMLSAVALVTSACASPDEGLSPVLFTPELPARGPTIVVVPSRDARVFTNASHPTPKPSLLGDVDDTQLSSRVLGRHLSSNGMLGANVVLESGITVSDLVDQAIVAGLRNAGIRATVEESGARTHQAARALHTTIYEFWLYRRSAAGSAPSPTGSAWTSADRSQATAVRPGWRSRDRSLPVASICSSGARPSSRRSRRSRPGLANGSGPLRPGPVAEHLAAAQPPPQTQVPHSTFSDCGVNV
jgi:hypothetical protein